MPMSEDDAIMPHNRKANMLRDISHKREALAACPEGHPDRDRLSGELVKILCTGYQQTGDSALIEEGIEVEREALALRPPGHPERVDSCANLATLLHMHYEQCGNLALLDESINLKREALVSRPPGHPTRAVSCHNLADLLDLRYHQCGDFTLLDEAIDLNREALALLPSGHSARALICHNLASSLSARYEQCGDPALLDETTRLQREVLALLPLGHPKQAISCNNLASSLDSRYAQCGDITLLNEAIDLKRQVLALIPQSHPQRALSCSSLANSLRTHYQQCSDLTLLDEAIKLEREALGLRPPGHPDRAASYANLGTSLHARYALCGDPALLHETIVLWRQALALIPLGHPERCGDLTLLDEAITLEREVLALQPLGHPTRALSCNNLAASLDVRYHLCGDIALLDEAIELNRKALGLRPPGHPARERSCNNLGNTLHARYEQCGDLTLLDEAIELKREALALLPPGNPERAVNCNNLANSLRTRYTQCDDLTLLDKAIELEREALALHPPGDPMRARSCNNLSASLYARYQRCDDLTLLDEVDKLVREALALRPPGHPMHLLSCRNLSYSLMNCYDRTKNSALLDEAIKPGGYALDSDTSVDASHSFAVLAQLHLIPHTSHFSIVKALHYLDLSFGSDVNDIHDLFRSTIANLFRVWDLSSIWTPETRLLLCGVYVKIIDRLPLVAGFVLNTPSQLQVLKSTHHIGTDACVAAMLAGQLSQAVELLDRSHGIVWTQALHQRDPRMEGAPPELASELERLLRAMATAAPINIGEEASYHHQDVRHKNSNMIQAILREVRAKPGLERFMLGSTYTTLREAAHNHPVVVLVAGRSQAFALIMPSSSHTSPDILRLDITSATLQSFANSVGQANLRFRECSPSGQDVPLVNLIGPDRAMRPGDHLTHRSPLARLWLSVVKPVLTHLGLTKQEDPTRRPRLHWCTAGDFAPLPIHAAGIYAGKDQQCCSDYVVSSYTPTLSTLLRARKSIQPITTANTKILLVAAEHTADTRLPPLGDVKVEMRDICSVVEKAGVQYAASSQSVSRTAQVMAALPAANLVHIACHGLQHTSEPLKSAFYLSDHDVLSVSDLMKLNLKGAFLAFLSACETAKGDRDQPDQAIHLAATMLFVGFKSVVATMWAMRDKDGPVVAKAFYEKLLEGDTINADTVPYALDYAVRKLRESGAPVGSWATFIHVGA